MVNESASVDEVARHLDVTKTTGHRRRNQYDLWIVSKVGLQVEVIVQRGDRIGADTMLGAHTSNLVLKPGWNQCGPAPTQRTPCPAERNSVYSWHSEVLRCACFV